MALKCERWKCDQGVHCVNVHKIDFRQTFRIFCSCDRLLIFRAEHVVLRILLQNFYIIFVMMITFYFSLSQLFKVFLLLSFMFLQTYCQIILEPIIQNVLDVIVQQLWAIQWKSQKQNTCLKAPTLDLIKEQHMFNKIF